MKDDVDFKDFSMHTLWWIFKETAEKLNLTKEEIELIKSKLEEKLYGRQSDT